ncbi:MULTISPECIES: ABC transporter permease [Enterococcaceae]|uniref:ABC transporter permease n=1 Tax=Enterococcaceae TaxID=81852 RepID=UPI000E51ADA4|nr:MULTISPECIES: ABC transporter permease [Enterococcaceae]MCI0130255.1 ABC transporter permease [Vagococcus sp. CY53-2]RGI31113.1 ABC transporter permease [Melissococcus sp. OM08-11BH]RHH71636.1 ABC transporter permease [Vagococcus sp. AM17-17]UNM89075.1 ABC transporter permease [Vagococcus sp. CY52-2]
MNTFLLENGNELVVKTFEHIYISVIALLLGVIVAVPLGIALTRTNKLANIIIGLASVLQTIPSLALLTMFIPFFGVGKMTAVVALFIYSLLPILRNTYLGIKGVDPNMVDAAKGMGMTDYEQIRLVEVPLALPTIMRGIRLGTVYVIAWATLASYIGGGGLGDLIFSGLNLYKPELIIGGTIPVVLLALISDFLLGLLEKRLSPKMKEANS